MAFSNPLHIVVLLLILVVCGEAKVFAGIVNSRSAWEDKGTFITKFCFHDRRALFKYETNVSSTGKWYFYLDDHWSDVLAETECTRKLAKSRFSVDIHNIVGEQFVNQWLRPHFWYVVYADEYTCRTDPPDVDNSLGYTLVFLNPDSSGDATDHFGEDQKGLLSMYALLIILYIGGISLFARSVWQTIQKGGPMHEVLQMLSVAIAIHFMATFFMLIHLWIYKNDGEGSVFFETASEILDVLAQLTMVWMILWMSLGWTLGSTNHPLRERKQLGLMISVTVIEVLLVLWEQSYDESHYTYHPHENLPGILLVALRIGLACLFCYNLVIRLKSERSTLRKNFYQAFAIACYLWFLAFPCLMIFAMIFPQYWRHRVVTIGTVIIQSIAMLWLSKQFLSRSLYWEVSTLSSTTLPFKRDRGGTGMIDHTH